MALSELKALAAEWLQIGKPPLQEDRRCFHWPLEFPEVFPGDGAGLHAIVGNPPFQGGQKITGVLGTDYRNWLVQWVADGRRGSADLVSYFFLRASELAARHGGFSLLATNTIAQGDTREVGLDRLVQRGWTITRAVKSRPWPGDASLEVAEVWAHRSDWSGAAIIDDQTVPSISATLEAKGRVEGTAHRLGALRQFCFKGSEIGGLGFTLTSDEKERLFRKDIRNREVVFPFINGNDLNSSPRQAASRFVINFFNWPLERAEGYPDCLEIVRARVKPERDANPDPYRRKTWWRFTRPTVDLYEALIPLQRSIAIALQSKTVTVSFVENGLVFANTVSIFAYDDDAHFGVLSSVFHYWWAIVRGSTLRVDPRYTSTDCFETFPQPKLTSTIADAGQRLDEYRRDLMIERWEGLTKTYNRVHDSYEGASDIVELRRLHVELDHAVAAAYGWSDLPLDHDFHETRQGIRYTLGPAVRTEMLDRLLELNHERYKEEVRLGRHDKPTRKGPKDKPAPKLSFGHKQPTLEGSWQPTLGDE